MFFLYNCPEVLRMANVIGKKLCALRKKKGISQKEMADLLCKKGVMVTNQAVSKWESGASYPNAVQFLILCDILDVSDIGGIFLGKSHEILSGLNAEGQKRVTEYADMLRDSGRYDADNPSGPRGSKLRRLPVYNIDVVSGTGKFLDSDDYELVTVGNEVPLEANFGVKISGDSMEPDYHDGQTVWIRQQAKLEHGDVGVFMYERKCYFKRLRDRVGGMRLQSIDSNYPDIIIANPEIIMTFGKAVG